MRRNEEKPLKRIVGLSGLVIVGLMAAGCKGKQEAPKTMQAMPVQTTTISISSVAQTSEYVATIKSRRSATLQPQVDGRLISIHVHSGDHVRAGQVMMEIDSLHQKATVASAKATERQKKATLDYDSIDLDRKKKLFEAGVTSRDSYDQSVQSHDNAKADYEAAVESRKVAEEQLAYYSVKAPFEGVVGDVPVHVGDYVSSSTTLTTVDENRDLEAYIYIPTERSGEIKQGLEVALSDNSGKELEKTKVNFVSPQVDSSLQGILVKAPVHATPEMIRNAQLIKAKVTWASKPMALVPVLAVTRLSGQNFVYLMKGDGGHFQATQIPVKLGDTVGNNYSVISGLNAGDQVITSSTQFLTNGMPVMALPAGMGSGAPAGAGK